MQKNKNSNAKKAFTEIGDMFGIGGNKEQNAAKSTAAPVAKAEDEKAKKADAIFAELKNKESAAEAARPAAQDNSANRVTVIGEGMNIAGNLENSGDIEIYGSVQGDVTGRKISVYGKVIGDIKATEAELHAATVKGSIMAEGDVVMDEGSVLSDGTLTAKNLYCNSTALCDIVLEERLHLEANAHVEGNVSCKRLQIDDGALVKGTFNCL